ncbi:hypothetical protein V1477_010216 [Vespula maculifrons]|uniref:Uncharacterized protein n=1 Tax=Vespula maculifrons TaxID=7453 RepID=A0ABD2C7Z5_VESMC
MPPEVTTVRRIERQEDKGSFVAVPRMDTFDEWCLRLTAMGFRLVDSDYPFLLGIHSRMMNSVRCSRKKTNEKEVRSEFQKVFMTLMRSVIGFSSRTKDIPLEVLLSKRCGSFNSYWLSEESANDSNSSLINGTTSDAVRKLVRKEKGTLLQEFAERCLPFITV